MADFLFRSILIGVGATAIFDLWGLLLKQVFGLPGANWAPVGRWFCHLAGGRIFHEDIAKAPPFAHAVGGRLDRPLPRRHPFRRHPARRDAIRLGAAADTDAAPRRRTGHRRRRLVPASAGNGRGRSRPPSGRMRTRSGCSTSSGTSSSAWASTRPRSSSARASDPKVDFHFWDISDAPPFEVRIVGCGPHFAFRPSRSLSRTPRSAYGHRDPR